jgi:hypothetical protein
MILDRHPVFLRRALAADAVASGATGLLMALGAGPLTALLGLPEALLREAGLFLIPFAALVGFLAFRQGVPVPAVWAVIACNAVWAFDSVALLMTGWVAPTLLGTAFTLFQAAVVAGFAGLQVVGLRRMQAAAA